jgi:hypothetical protein
MEHRRGVYLGKTGTFVKKEWELGVLAGCLYIRWLGVDPTFGPPYEIYKRPFERLDPRKVDV